MNFVMLRRRLTRNLPPMRKPLHQYKTQYANHTHPTTVSATTLHGVNNANKNTHSPPNPNTPSTPIFCRLGNLSRPNTGIGKTHTTQSNTIPTTLVDRKCNSALKHVPELVMSQYLCTGLHRKMTPKTPQAAAPVMRRRMSWQRCFMHGMTEKGRRYCRMKEVFSRAVERW